MWIFTESRDYVAGWLATFTLTHTAAGVFIVPCWNQKCVVFVLKLEQVLTFFPLKRQVINKIAKKQISWNTHTHGGGNAYREKKAKKKTMWTTVAYLWMWKIKVQKYVSSLEAGLMVRGLKIGSKIWLNFPQKISSWNVFKLALYTPFSDFDGDNVWLFKAFSMPESALIKPESGLIKSESGFLRPKSKSDLIKPELESLRNRSSEVKI